MESCLDKPLERQCADCLYETAKRQAAEIERLKKIVQQMRTHPTESTESTEPLGGR